MPLYVVKLPLDMHVENALVLHALRAIYVAFGIFIALTITFFIFFREAVRIAR